MAQFYEPLTEATVDRYIERLQKITGVTQPAWGAMNAATMLAHLRRNVELALGEVEATGASFGLLRLPALWYLTRQGPFPKNSRSFDFLFPPASGQAEEERDRLLAGLTRFAQAHSDNPKAKTKHPKLGELKLSTWAKLLGKHLEHHLRQFGV